MLTPQEVQSKTFEKAMRGYQMTSVDEFLDALTQDYTTLYKENAALKTKLKVMVDKVEEYRATEDNMRSALAAAQRMADNLVNDAQRKKDELLKDVEAVAQQRKEELKNEILAEEQKLNKAKAETARFLQQAKDLCVVLNSKMDAISQEDLAPTVSAVEEVKEEKDVIAEKIEEAVFQQFQVETPAEEVVDEEAAPVQEAAQEEEDDDFQNPFVEDVSNEVKADFSKSKAVAVDDDDDFEVTRSINLKELKFGSGKDKK